MKKIQKIFSILSFSHKCNYKNKLYDIPMHNNTNFLITQCICGKTNIKRVHRESETYINWNNYGINKK